MYVHCTLLYTVSKVGKSVNRSTSGGWRQGALQLGVQLCY